MIAMKKRILIILQLVVITIAVQAQNNYTFVSIKQGLGYPLQTLSYNAKVAVNTNLEFGYQFAGKMAGIGPMLSIGRFAFAMDDKKNAYVKIKGNFRVLYAGIGGIGAIRLSRRLLFAPQLTFGVLNLTTPLIEPREITIISDREYTPARRKYNGYGIKPGFGFRYFVNEMLMLIADLDVMLTTLEFHEREDFFAFNLGVGLRF